MQGNQSLRGGQENRHEQATGKEHLSQFRQELLMARQCRA